MSRANVLAVLEHHAELMKIDRDGMSNADAKAIYEQLYKDATEARAAIVELIDVLGGYLHLYETESIDDAWIHHERLRAAIVACKGGAA